MSAASRKPRKVIVDVETKSRDVASPNSQRLSMVVVNFQTGKRVSQIEMPATLSVADLKSLLANHEKEAAQRALQKAVYEKRVWGAKNRQELRVRLKAQATEWAKGLGRPFKVTAEVADFWVEMTVSLTVSPGVVLRFDLHTEDRDEKENFVTVAYAYLDCKALDVTCEKHLGEHEKFEDALKAADKHVKAVFRLNLADMPVLGRMMNEG